MDKCETLVLTKGIILNLFSYDELEEREDTKKKCLIK